eukprot:TRINITY_DN3552_c0_g2_i4.p1 TRINITY_DN3552_c0_g2~~TRINITY_DN3552_c0_g2_i4.p1  ORF type:complete len:873 (-),score=219.76 TRINITY_DN3552_c0_g2_i4:312-2930(-)
MSYTPSGKADLRLNLMGLSPTSASPISLSVPNSSTLAAMLNSSNTSHSETPSPNGSRISPFATLDQAIQAWKEKCNQVSQLKIAEHLLQQQNTELQKRIAVLEVMKDELEGKLQKKDKDLPKSLKGSSSSSKKKSVNFTNLEVLSQLSLGVFLCNVDGWQCQMKEVPLDKINEKDRSQIEKEITTIEELPSHPNLLRYLFHTKEKNSLRIFTARIPSSLRDYLDALTVTPAAEIIHKWLLDILRGLEVLHKYNILHRDLTSKNIYVQFDERTEMVSKLIIGNYDSAKKIKSAIAISDIGSTTHMAPEVFSAGADKASGTYSAKSDVWSFGMTIYEILTLSRPYNNVPPGLIPGIVCSGSRPALPDSIANNMDYQVLVDLFHDCTRFEPEARPSLEKIKANLFLDSANLSPKGKSRASQILSLEWMNVVTLSIADWSSLQDKIDPNYGPPLVSKERGFVTEEGCSGLKKSNLQPEDAKAIFYFDRYLAKTELDIFVNKDTSDPVVIYIQKNTVGYEEEAASSPAHMIASPRVKNEGISRQYFAMISTARGDERALVQTTSKSPPSAKDKLALLISNRPLLTSLKFLHIENPKPMIEEMVAFEKKEISTKLKFGVLYVKPGQSTEDEMYNNAIGSKQQDEFLDFLGDIIVLENWPRFAGGLDTTGRNNDGEYSYFTIHGDYEIMFHVSTKIKFNENDPQQVQRKKHLGNDVVLIIFKDAEDISPFKPSSMVSQFNHVFIVVQPVLGSNPTKYRVAVVAKEGVVMHPPHLPNPAIFEKDGYFRSFLLSKLINAEKAAMKANIFANKFQRVRTEVLKDMCNRHLNPKEATPAKTPRVKSIMIEPGGISVKGGWNRLQPDPEQMAEMLALANGVGKQ